jgi:dephospho-CoA kinase
VEVVTNFCFQGKGKEGKREETTMRMVGLTGGIASGKSTVSRQLQAQGIPVIDADKVAQAALRKNTWGWRRVVAVFGNGILQENGEVDRAKLGEIVFSDAAKRKQLNRAMEPCIMSGLFYEILKHWILGTSVVVLDVPLLFEAKIDWLTRPIIVVWVDDLTQETRLMARDNSSKEQARNRITSQLPLDVKRARADIVIDNSGSLEQTKVLVNDLKKTITAPPSWKELLFSRLGVAAMVIGVITITAAKLQ